MTWGKYWDSLRSLAFGEMNMRPKEFYEMSLEEFSLKLEGFIDNRIWLERSMRRLGQIVQAPHVKDAPSMLRQWPIKKDDEISEIRREASKRNAVNTLASFIRNAQGEKPINES